MKNIKDDKDMDAIQKLSLFCRVGIIVLSSLLVLGIGINIIT